VGSLRGAGQSGAEGDDAKTKSGQKSTVHAESFGNANGARSVYAGGLENKNWKMEIRRRSARVGLGNSFARQRDKRYYLRGKTGVVSFEVARRKGLGPRTPDKAS
jgi:hypothetical protein